jgi:hypothetical protein
MGQGKGKNNFPGVAVFYCHALFIPYLNHNHPRFQDTGLGDLEDKKARVFSFDISITPGEGQWERR